MCAIWDWYCEYVELFEEANFCLIIILQYFIFESHVFYKIINVFVFYIRTLGSHIMSFY